MPRRPTGQILEHTDRAGVVSYSVRFRGAGYPTEVIPLGRSDEGMNRARAEHEARLVASQILAATWSPPPKAEYVQVENINQRDARIRFRKPIPKAQALLGTGILTISYRGDADTRPQTVRLRAASQPANLRLTRPTISNGRLRAAGSVSKRARGVVRVQLEYVVAGRTHTREFKARIANGRWSLNQRLSQTVRSAIRQRTGTVHSYTLFTGYYQRRVRGEMRSYQILGPR